MKINVYFENGKLIEYGGVINLRVKKGNLYIIQKNQLGSKFKTIYNEKDVSKIEIFKGLK